MGVVAEAGKCFNVTQHNCSQDSETLAKIGRRRGNYYNFLFDERNFILISFILLIYTWVILGYSFIHCKRRIILIMSELRFLNVSLSTFT